MKKLQREVGEASATVTEQKALIAQLEDDLRNVNALSSLFRGDAEVSEWVNQATVEYLSLSRRYIIPLIRICPRTPWQ